METGWLPSHSAPLLKKELARSAISCGVFIKNVIAVAAYIQLASQSQAKFHNKQNWVSFRLPCAAAPAQSTASAYLSLQFSPHPCAVVLRHALSQWPSQALFEARNDVSWSLLTSLDSRSQEWAFFHVTFGIKRLIFRLVWKVVRCLSTKQDGGCARCSDGPSWTRGSDRHRSHSDERGCRDHHRGSDRCHEPRARHSPRLQESGERIRPSSSSGRSSSSKHGVGSTDLSGSTRASGKATDVRPSSTHRHLSLSMVLIPQTIRDQHVLWGRLRMSSSSSEGYVRPQVLALSISYYGRPQVPARATSSYMTWERIYGPSWVVSCVQYRDWFDNCRSWATWEEDNYCHPVASSSSSRWQLGRCNGPGRCDGPGRRWGLDRCAGPGRCDGPGRSGGLGRCDRPGRCDEGSAGDADLAEHEDSAAADSGEGGAQQVRVPQQVRLQLGLRHRISKDRIQWCCLRMAVWFFRHCLDGSIRPVFSTSCLWYIDATSHGHWDASSRQAGQTYSWDVQNQRFSDPGQKVQDSSEEKHHDIHSSDWSRP